jgi:hypothetical protein
MARPPKSTGIAFSLLLLAAAAAASDLLLLNSTLPDPAAVVADLHRYISLFQAVAAAAKLQPFVFYIYKKGGFR